MNNSETIFLRQCRLPLLRQFEAGDERIGPGRALLQRGLGGDPGRRGILRQELFERQPAWRLRQTFQNPRAGWCCMDPG